MLVSLQTSCVTLGKSLLLSGTWFVVLYNRRFSRSLQQMGVVWLGSGNLWFSGCASGHGLLPSQPAQVPAHHYLLPTPLPRPHGISLGLSTGHMPEPQQSGWALVVVLTFGVHSWDSRGCSGLVFQPDVHVSLME